MAKKDDRFERTYKQGSLEIVEIWVDKLTGVNYVYHMSGYSGGLTVLLDKDGKPIISEVTSNIKYIERNEKQ